MGGCGEVMGGDAEYSCVTSVTRLPDDSGSELLRAARTIAGVKDHYVYPATDLHLTVANLDMSSLDERTLGQRIGEAVAAVQPFDVELRGIAMTSQSIYAQAWDSSGALWRLRGLVQDAAGIRLPFARRLLGFVNVVRFRNPALGSLISGVRDLARADLGRFTVRAIEVVRTDKLLSVERTEVISATRLTLRGGKD